MIGYVKKITRFGLFIDIFFKENRDIDLSILKEIQSEHQEKMTGLLRWSEIPGKEKFFLDEKVYNITFKQIRADKKIDLALNPESFLDKYEHKVCESLKILESLHSKNQEVRSL